MRVTVLFFFNEPATTVLYTYCHTLSLHDALPIFSAYRSRRNRRPRHLRQPVRGIRRAARGRACRHDGDNSGIRHAFLAQSGDELRGQHRSEEHTSELQSLMRISYAVFCLKKKKHKTNTSTRIKITFTK